MTDEAVTNDTQIALDIARQLIEAGVPVFAAEPCPEGCPGTVDKNGRHVPHKGGPGKYHPPRHWEKMVPSLVNLERWRPGWALAAVGGHRLDFLDVDPRNGGDVSLAELKAAGHMPRIFGEAVTPSGGRHFPISPTGERKSTGFMPGLDLQSGAEDGLGRGFVWIAPTVRPSKDPRDQGALKPYRWIQPPDPEVLEEFQGTHDATTEGVVSRVTARRTPVPRQRQEVDLEADPFMSSSQTFGSLDRSFTQGQAMDFCRQVLLDLQAAPLGQIEERCNTAAATLSHFIPEFWSVDQGMTLLEAALGHTAYDPEGPGEWTVEKFRLVLDGTRPPLDPWVATRRPEPAAPPMQSVEAAPGEEALTTLEKLKRKLVSASDLANQPAPEPLVYGLLDMDTESWMIGAPGSLKSFVALDLAGHVGAGREWQGHKVRRANVLYVAAEGARGLVLRTRAWEKSFGAMEGVSFLPYPVQVQSTDGQWAALVEIARELAPGLIVLDTQARMTVGLEENSAKDMGILTNAVGMLKRATGACVLVVHHTGRNGGDARGSSALDGAQDTELKVVRSSDRKVLACRVIQDKQKDMAEGDGHGLDIRLKVVGLGVDPTTERPLSSLVLMGQGDPFDEAQGHQVLDVRQPWLPSFSSLDTWRRRYLDTLFTFAPENQGLTKADLDLVMKTNWPDFEPRNSGPKKAWKDLLEVVDPDGSPVVAKVGGERWGVVSLSVRAALVEELGAAPSGQVSLPGAPAASE
jgi:hypothetical protein